MEFASKETEIPEAPNGWLSWSSSSAILQEGSVITKVTTVEYAMSDGSTFTRTITETLNIETLETSYDFVPEIEKEEDN